MKIVNRLYFGFKPELNESLECLVALFSFNLRVHGGGYKYGKYYWAILGEEDNYHDFQQYVRERNTKISNQRV